MAGPLAALLMGAGQRAAQIQRRDEERAYQEKVKGSDLAGQALFDMLKDPTRTYEDQQALAGKIEENYGMKKGTLQDVYSKIHQIHPHIEKALGQQPMPPIPEMVAQKQYEVPPSTSMTVDPAITIGGGALQGQQAPAVVEPNVQMRSFQSPQLAPMPAPPVGLNPQGIAATSAGMAQGQGPKSELERIQRAHTEALQQKIKDMQAIGARPEDIQDMIRANVMPASAQAAYIRNIGAENVAKIRANSQLVAGTKGHFAMVQEPDGEPERVFQIESGPMAGMTRDSAGNIRKLAQGTVTLYDHPDKIEYMQDPVTKEVTAYNVTRKLGGDKQVSLGTGQKFGGAGSSGEITPYQQAMMGSRSYEARTKELDKLVSPIEDRMARIDRLFTTLNSGPTGEGSAAADPEVAPELITIMAGGMGSGVRITQAEVSASIGGRSNWQALQAALNQWKMGGNPDAGLKVDPIQREQIRNLIGLVADKMHRKLEISNKAKQDLIDAGDDVKKHKEIVLEARKALNAVDYEAAEANKNKAGAAGGGTAGPSLGEIPEQLPFTAQVTSNGQTKEYDIKNADDLAALKNSKLSYKVIRKAK